jgi:hypothetical protein
MRKKDAVLCRKDDRFIYSLSQINSEIQSRFGAESHGNADSGHKSSPELP